MILGAIIFIPAFLNGTWTIINHTPFAMAVKFEMPGGGLLSDKMYPNGTSKSSAGGITKVTLQGVQAITDKNYYFGGNESAIILQHYIGYHPNFPDYMAANRTFDVFAQFGGTVNKGLPLSIIADKVRFLLIIRPLGRFSSAGGGIVSTSPWYEIKSGALVKS